jgi:hypothetical protein
LQRFNSRPAANPSYCMILIDWHAVSQRHNGGEPAGSVSRMCEAFCEQCLQNGRMFPPDLMFFYAINEIIYNSTLEREIVFHFSMFDPVKDCLEPLQNVLKHGKPFVCSICGKSFVRQVSLRQHSRAHSAVEQGLKCVICEKTFSRPPDRTKHMKVCRLSFLVLKDSNLCGDRCINKSKLIFVGVVASLSRGMTF